MSGTGVHATVRLTVARIGGQFTLSGVTDSNPAEPLVDLHGTDVAGGAHICADASTAASRSGVHGSAHPLRPRHRDRRRSGVHRAVVGSASRRVGLATFALARYADLIRKTS